jgi:hypothetical protein
VHGLPIWRSRFDPRPFLILGWWNKPGCNSSRLEFWWCSTSTSTSPNHLIHAASPPAHDALHSAPDDLFPAPTAFQHQHQHFYHFKDIQFSLLCNSHYVPQAFVIYI